MSVWSPKSGAEVQVVHIAGTAVLRRLGSFGAHFLAAAAACCVNRVLAIVTLTGELALAGGLREVLAHFGTGQAGLEAGIRRDELGLLGKGGAGCGKDGKGCEEVLDVHGVLQSVVSDSGLGGQGMLLPVGSCLAESHCAACVLIDEAQFSHSLWINKQHSRQRNIA